MSQIELDAMRAAMAEQYKQSLYLTAKHLLGYTDVNRRTHGDLINCLEAKSQKKLIVMPRGTFKCLSKNVNIYGVHGRPYSIAHAQPGDEILSWSDGRMVKSRIVAVQETPKRTMLRVKLRSGREIEASPNHRFLTILGWKELQELPLGTRIAHWAGAEMDHGHPAPAGHAWLLGMLIGDGSCANATISIHHDNVLSRTIKAVKECGFSCTYTKEKNLRLRNGIRPFMDKYGIREKTSWTKSIPDAVWDWDLASRREFVAAYFSCDAHCNKLGKTTLSTVSNKLANQMLDLLKTIGVFGKLSYHEYEYSKFYAIHIDDNVSQANLLKCPLEMKLRDVAISPQDGFWRSVPKEWRKKGLPKGSRKRGIRIDNNYDTSFTKFRIFAEEIGLEWASTDEMIWDQIVAVEEFEDTSIDIEVEGTHTFIANGLVTHNSTITSVAWPIWLLMRDPNERILLDSEVYTNSKNFLREIRWQLERPEVTQLFGTFKSDNWSEGEMTVSQRTKGYKEASITASGIGAIKVGQHYSTIIMDDLNSQNNSATVEGRMKVVRHYQMNRAILEPDGKLAVVGTRYATDDIIGHVMQQEIQLEEPSE